MVKNKSGVSGMVGYVLLIGIVMAIAGFMFIFLRSYVPEDDLTCPEGGAISMLSYTCELVSPITGIYKLNVSLKNSGRFDLHGYSIYATNTTDPDKPIIATVDLSQYLKETPDATKSGAQSIFLKPTSPNGLTTSQTTSQLFANIPYNIFSVDITPIIKVETKDNRLAVVACSDSKIKERITCS